MRRPASPRRPAVFSRLLRHRLLPIPTSPDFWRRPNRFRVIPAPPQPQSRATTSYSRLRIPSPPHLICRSSPTPIIPTFDSAPRRSTRYSEYLRFFAHDKFVWSRVACVNFIIDAVPPPPPSTSPTSPTPVPDSSTMSIPRSAYASTHVNSTVHIRLDSRFVPRKSRLTSAASASPSVSRVPPTVATARDHRLPQSIVITPVIPVCAAFSLNTAQRRS
ncbi:hypothetical protein B0H19DRAFT_1275264 [Mycena capillaripes]|nr:hypothetical protein B0H19DRAFT_1275264 [Mycena capillaripes]